MKRPLFIFLILLSVVFAASCSGKSRINLKDGFYVDSETGIKYSIAIVSYEPLSRGKEYASCEDYFLYTMGDADPKEWLAEEFDGIGAVYYSEDTFLPPLENFEASRIYVGNEGDVFVALAEIDNKNVINSIIDCLAVGERTIVPSAYDAAYQLKITSSKYNWLCYSLMYIQTEEINIIYDRGTGVCVDAGNLLSDYIYSDGD